MEFREYIVKHFAPVVAVLASPEAEKSCQDAAGLSLAELLRPFASLRGLSGEIPFPMMPFRDDQAASRSLKRIEDQEPLHSMQNC